MRPNRTLVPRGGFTAVEMLIVIVITGVLALMGVPLLQSIIHKTKMEGQLGKTSFLFHVAKSESVKQNFNTVVRIDPAARQITAFVDLNGAALGTAPDGVFNPIAGEPRNTTDYELATYDLPSGIEFEGPGATPIVDGFTTVDNNGTDEQVAIFISDGSIVDIGAFRVGDRRDNFFEIRIAPQGTARVQVRKYDPDEDDWFEQGEENRVWEWS